MIPLNFKCIVNGCHRNASPRHAICEFHLFVEITMTAFTGALVLWGLIWLALGRSN